MCIRDRIETEDKQEFVRKCTEMMEYINSSRPTAVNLSWALNRMHDVIDVYKRQVVHSGYKNTETDKSKTKQKGEINNVKKYSSNFIPGFVKSPRRNGTWRYHCNRRCKFCSRFHVDVYKRQGEYRDIAHPINSTTRDRIQTLILDKYQEVMNETDAQEEAAEE